MYQHYCPCLEKLWSSLLACKAWCPMINNVSFEGSEPAIPGRPYPVTISGGKTGECDITKMKTQIVRRHAFKPMIIRHKLCHQTCVTYPATENTFLQGSVPSKSCNLIRRHSAFKAVKTLSPLENMIAWGWSRSCWKVRGANTLGLMFSHVRSQQTIMCYKV